MDQEMQDRIRQRAYDLWLQNGQPDQSEMAFWLQAENQIKAEENGDTPGGIEVSTAQ
jgi:Protein of unknown function (DUF2934)